MNNLLNTEVTITINASPAEVWKALTTPELIREYLMGTHVTTDWKEGSPITYEGEYQGKKYCDKGKILQIKYAKIFQSTYWSSMGGKEDKAENYNKVTYLLKGEGNKTLVTLTQDNIATEKEKEHVTQNWNMVLKKLKEVVEEKVNA